MPPSSNPSGIRLTNYKLWQGLLIGYWLVLFAATHVPKEFPGVPTDHWDKIAHFTAYAVLAVILATTWQLAAGQLNFAHLVASWILLALYGAFDEWTQLFVRRDASFLDWLADVAGAAAGLTLFLWMRKRRAQ